ncbi:3'-5' exoribonuclease [Luteolibacter arcticus]|uniref:3'-5' exoribonuclease n=1 Tax=Luteolibacter arcticus TaxID=1581411 RepID=A0ABT3GGY2_9BACT|nr:3'-5' exonuclease [Luteolibacter arcticus]MCW1922693.1 3'-5' exoribonuclease [Luteolibacter arcticus]
MKDLFLDIEALGRKPGSAIIQLGAIVFDPDTGATAEEFHRYINPNPDLFTSDLGTLAWHAEQGTWPHPPGLEITDEAAAFCEFVEWFGTLAHAGHVIEDAWSWGITYDFGLLAPYFEHYTGGAPWRYRQVTDARSFWKRAFPGIKHKDRPHHALEDCRDGIKDLVSALRELTAGRDLARDLERWEHECGESTDIVPPENGRKLWPIIARAKDIAFSPAGEEVAP